MKNPEFLKAFDGALRKISRRDHSRAEIVTYLKRKKHTPELIAQVIEELQRLGYIRELELVRMIVRAWTHKGRGLKAIEHKLRQVGISAQNEEVRAVLDELLGALNPQDQLEQLITGRFARDLEACLTLPYPQKLKAKVKLFKKLVSRGFEMSEVERALRKLLRPNASNTEGGV